MYWREVVVVQCPREGSTFHGRRLVEDLSTARLSDAFLADEACYCAESTIWKYRWALGCLERVYPTLPRFTTAIIRFVGDEPLQSSNSKRNLWNTIRDFYSCIKETENPLVPELSLVNFGRRAGERRGRKATL